MRVAFNSLLPWALSYMVGLCWYHTHSVVSINCSPISESFSMIPWVKIASTSWSNPTPLKSEFLRQVLDDFSDHRTGLFSCLFTWFSGRAPGLNFGLLLLLVTTRINLVSEQLSSFHSVPLVKALELSSFMHGLPIGVASALDPETRWGSSLILSEAAPCFMGQHGSLSSPWLASPALLLLPLRGLETG